MFAKSFVMQTALCFLHSVMYANRNTYQRYTDSIGDTFEMFRNLCKISILLIQLNSTQLVYKNDWDLQLICNVVRIQILLRNTEDSGTTENVVPVSYTHLDVYKRQTG